MGSFDAMPEARDIGQDTILFLLRADVPPEYEARLKSKYPGLKIKYHNMLTPDAILTPTDLPRELFENVTILCTQILPPAEWLPKAHYIQLTAAGADKHQSNPLYTDPLVLLCTSNGMQSPQIAEWVLASYLSFSHRFAHHAAQQSQSHWPSWYERATGTASDSVGQRIGILGYGAIGRQVGRLAKALGMEVFAFTARERRTRQERRDESYSVPVPGSGDVLGDPEGVVPSAWFYGTTREAVNEFLAKDLDVLVLAMPLTASNRGILDAEQFEILSKKKTFVANVGRGQHIVTDALVRALETGQIRGAALDVTDPEPLPPDHALWKAPNVFITPHVSWQSLHYFTRVMDIVERNLERLSRGERPLINQIDKGLNY